MFYSNEPNRLVWVLVVSVEFAALFSEFFLHCMCESLCLYGYPSICTRSPLMESQGWRPSERAGRGKVQPRADLYF